MEVVMFRGDGMSYSRGWTVSNGKKLLVQRTIHIHTLDDDLLRVVFGLITFFER
jgi:hypothetical protein